MFSRELHDLQSGGLIRSIISRQSAQGRKVCIEGRPCLNFSSNDYLGLADHPEVIAAVESAVAEFGAGSGASRLLAGGTVLHWRLEKEISRFKSSESAILFNSGYSANTGVIPSIASGGCVIFSDELNHASIIDGCRLSRAKTLIYRHRDVSDLELLMRKEKGKRRVVVTDSVFSMDGDMAPLADIREVCLKYGCLLYIDDAHATGVLGKGRGSLSHFGMDPEPWIIQMGTFSKALGSFGAFIAGSRETTEWITNTARSLILSTALPAHVVAASLAALSIVKRDRRLLRRLWTNRERMANGLRETGCDVGVSETPILPVRMQNVREALRLSGFLLDKGFYAPAIRPPSVSEPRIRLTASAAHTEEDADRLIEAMKDFYRPKKNRRAAGASRRGKSGPGNKVEA
jgi:8-amino-7-oxononanoate synthase